MQTTDPNPHLQSLRATLDKARGDVGRCTTTTASGRLTRAVGLVLEAVGLQLPVGSDCLIELPPGHPQRHAEAEVVGFAGDRLFLMSQTEVAGLLPGARVFARPGLLEPGTTGDAHTKRLPVGEGMLGRVVDAAGRPLRGTARTILVQPNVVIHHQMADAGAEMVQISPGKGKNDQLHEPA